MRYLLLVSVLFGSVPTGQTEELQPLPKTKPLTVGGDIASKLVEGVDQFLLKEIDKSVTNRARHWKRDVSSPEAYNQSITPNRKRLAHILGVRDKRIPVDELQLQATTGQEALIASSKKVKVYAVQWASFGDVHGEGILLEPTWNVKANVIVVPDADQIPEQLIGLLDGIPGEQQYPRLLAEAGCRVLIPTLIDRTIEPRHGRVRLPAREWLYRPSFEMGRHPLGYEIQKVLSLVDFLSKKDQEKIGIIGYGEGGLIAMYAAALDTRIDAALLSGCVENRNDVWSQMIERNVFGLLDEFGDAEVLSMIAPRPVIVEASMFPERTLSEKGAKSVGRGAPGRIVTPSIKEVTHEFERFQTLIKNMKSPRQLVVSGKDGKGPAGMKKTIQTFLSKDGLNLKINYQTDLPPLNSHDSTLIQRVTKRQYRQLHELERHTQQLLKESPYIRKEFFSKVNTKSMETFKETIEPYRKYFYDEIIGRFDYKLLPFNARSRIAYDKEKWTGHEVVLDVFPGVIAYGVLLLPKGMKPNEKHPVVVCQHGLEGRPQDIITGDHRAYHDFAAKLAERGFIVFAPQNPYIFKHRFRTLQRKANPLKKTLFSIIVPQHQQIVNWLKTLPNVDEKRIAFYGLSYGGKTAMRVPPLVTDYCLSICSADFNDWIWKNVSTRAKYSYVWTGEYEIFEFDLGNTFNYSEMAALIAPRPFMVERGHFDGVAPDERVAYEFAKVRFFYQARLGLKNRCEIEWFVGPHTINGKGTFDFLHKHLNWPRQR